MLKDEVYNRYDKLFEGFLWCRLLYVGKRYMGGITLNGERNNHWVWIINKNNLEDWYLVSEIPEVVRDILFDPFVDIEFAKKVIRKGLNIE